MLNRALKRKVFVLSKLKESLYHLYIDASAPGLQKLLSEDPLPHHWEDVADIDTFEKVVKNTYNKVCFISMKAVFMIYSAPQYPRFLILSNCERV